jgi:hypothetical protein
MKSEVEIIQRLLKAVRAINYWAKQFLRANEALTKTAKKQSAKQKSIKKEAANEQKTV